MYECNAKMGMYVCECARILWAKCDGIIYEWFNAQQHIIKKNHIYAAV